MDEGVEHRPEDDEPEDEGYGGEDKGLVHWWFSVVEGLGDEGHREDDDSDDDRRCGEKGECQEAGHLFSPC